MIKTLYGGLQMDDLHKILNELLELTLVKKLDSRLPTFEESCKRKSYYNYHK